jgi:hypothetical protein
VYFNKWLQEIGADPLSLVDTEFWDDCPIHYDRSQFEADLNMIKGLAKGRAYFSTKKAAWPRTMGCEAT